MPRPEQEGGASAAGAAPSVAGGVPLWAANAQAIARARCLDHRHFRQHPDHRSYVRPYLQGEVPPELLEGRDPPAYVAVARVCSALLIRAERRLGFPVAEAQAEVEQLARAYGRGCEVANSCKTGRCRLLNRGRA